MSTIPTVQEAVEATLDVATVGLFKPAKKLVESELRLQKRKKDFKPPVRAEQIPKTVPFRALP